MAREIAFVAPGGTVDVGQHIIPKINLALVILRAEIRERARTQKKPVPVGCSKIEPARLLVQRVLQFLAKEGEEIEIVDEPKSAAMQHIVAVEQIDGRGLR